MHQKGHFNLRLEAMSKVINILVSVFTKEGGIDFVV